MPVSLPLPFSAPVLFLSPSLPPPLPPQTPYFSLSSSVSSSPSVPSAAKPRMPASPTLRSSPPPSTLFSLPFSFPTRLINTSCTPFADFSRLGEKKKKKLPPLESSSRGRSGRKGTYVRRWRAVPSHRIPICRSNHVGNSCMEEVYRESV